MVTYIAGNYLMDKGYLSKEQLAFVLEERKKVRVKLGLIAVAEGMMMQMEADEINQLQMVQDKRFGDIAVEQGYLTEKEVDYLLMKQGNEYLTLAQTLEDNKLMTLEELEEHMLELTTENSWGMSGLEDLKSNDLNRILPLFIPDEAERYIDLAGIVLRMIVRRIDSNVYPLKAYLTNSFQANHYAMQSVEGQKVFSCAIAGMEDEVVILVEKFLHESFEKVDDDVLDAAAEIVNCMNGLYASALSQAGVVMELLPPEYGTGPLEIQGEPLLVLPMVIQDKILHVLISMGSQLKLQ